MKIKLLHRFQLICGPSREKEPYGNCEKYRSWSGCAGWQRSKLFTNGRFSVY